jgi:hypothetical protein
MPSSPSGAPRWYTIQGSPGATLVPVPAKGDANEELAGALLDAQPDDATTSARGPRIAILFT